MTSSAVGRPLLLIVSLLTYNFNTGYGFSSYRLIPPRQAQLELQQESKCQQRKALFMVAQDNNNEDEAGYDATSIAEECWNPTLRKVLAAISSAGMVETGYLTYGKLFAPGVISSICGVDSSGGGCGSVLDGPYSFISIAGNDFPLAALGFGAYSLTTVLALSPLRERSEEARKNSRVKKEELDIANRFSLLITTTAMATFSSFLISLLFVVLHESCPFCVASAVLSVSLAVVSWSSDMLPTSFPESNKLGTQASLFGLSLSTVAALFLLVDVNTGAVSTTASDFSSSLMASTAKIQEQKDFPPPPITTHSSDRALTLADDLHSLDARMFGAYWCSHCYDQKERMGFEAMQQIPYVECSKEGLNSQNKLCKEKDVPGYPTWEIGGKLYPGEQELDELEDIVKDVKAKLN